MKKRKVNNKKPFAIFLRGGTGVGKTTIGKKLAEKISPSVFIEQDILRYMVVNGLVASRTRLHPGDYPDEYRKQCKLADKNTLDLVKNFTDEGFIVIVDGFNGGESGDTFYYLKNPEKKRWYPEEGLLKQKLPNVQIIQIVLDTKKEILIERLKLIKKWNRIVIDFILKQREIFLDTLDRNQVSLVIETSKMSPNQVCKRILKELR